MVDVEAGGGAGNPTLRRSEQQLVSARLPGDPGCPLSSQSNPNQGLTARVWTVPALSRCTLAVNNVWPDWIRSTHSRFCLLDIEKMMCVLAFVATRYISTYIAIKAQQ